MADALGDDPSVDEAVRAADIEVDDVEEGDDVGVGEDEVPGLSW